MPGVEVQQCNLDPVRPNSEVVRCDISEGYDVQNACQGNALLDHGDEPFG